MSWTYTPESMTSVDRVRLLIGDTDSTDPLLQDEEIQAFLTVAGSYRSAAVYAARAIAATFARDVDYQIGQDAREFLSQRSAQYQQLAKELQMQQSTMLGAGPRWGGKTRSSKDLDRQDPDRVQLPFSTDMQEDTGSLPDPQPSH